LSQFRTSQVREMWAEQLLPAGENNENGDRTMFTRILSACVVSLVAVSVSGAQDFTRMDLNAMNNAFNNSQNQQMNNQLDSVIRAKLNDPSFQAAYKQHVAQGGRSTPQQFAYWHAATRGGSAEGMAYFRATETRNQIAEQNSLNAYRQAQAARGQAQTEWMNRFQQNNAEFGNTLRGNSTYSNPYSGSNYVLPHTLQAGQHYRDTTGNVFQMDSRGNYYQYSNGYWYPLNSGR
jgi:hypothetical protein